MNKNSSINITIPKYALKVMERLWDAGEEAYIVGGSLRDSLIGLEAHDYDMTTSALPSRTSEIFSDMHVIETGLKHGTLTVVSEGNPIEITTFRVDGDYRDARHPESVSFTRSVEADLSRRDFTINAMAYDPRGTLIDLFGGREDLSKKIIRAVGEPKLRFEEDALRIMRAFRFSAQLGFDIEENTLRAADKCKDGLAKISRERIGVEFLRLICSEYPQKPIEQMLKMDIMPYVIGNCRIEKNRLDALSKMPREDVARLGFVFAGEDGASVREALALLKCSNKQKSGTLAVARGAIRRIDTPRAATMLRADVGVYDRFAVRASVLLGISDVSAIALVDGNTAPSRISDLAIDGTELGRMGIKGKDIGKMLEYLLALVIDEPKLNTSELLMKKAKEKQNEKGE